MKTYGKELIIDLHNCDAATFNRRSIKKYFTKLCDLIDMERSKLSWWDDHGVSIDEQQTEPHLKGTTAIQFITTSNIVIHTLDLLGAVYINIFSCKDFDSDIAMKFTAKWFKGEIVSSHEIERK
ncbi:MAG: S-adenosylmethionine decarboxylase [Bacteroidetes bacterium]|nr:S-adenosylmethionine decarboxylase [Bacteroidota bacterium]